MNVRYSITLKSEKLAYMKMLMGCKPELQRQYNTVARYLKGYKTLEPYAVKVARTVLRRGGASNRSSLFDVDRESAFEFMACNPENKKSGGMAVCLLMVRTFAIGLVVALVMISIAGAAIQLPTGRATIKNGFTDYGNSGFRFDSTSVVAWNSKQADILASSTNPTSNSLLFFLQYDAPPYQAEQDDEAWSGIIEMSQTKLEQVTECPSSGYKYHWAEAKVNAVYCVRTRDGQHFAKIKVIQTDNIMVFDWVYQSNGSRYFGSITDFGPTGVVTPSHFTVPLNPIANRPLVDFTKPPSGDIRLGEVPFHLDREFGTQQRDLLDNSNQGTINVNIPSPLKIYVLLHGGYVMKEFFGKEVGYLEMKFDDGYSFKKSIIVGKDLREGWTWDVPDGKSIVYIENNPNWQNVWSETQSRGDKPATAFIDMLTIPLPKEYQSRILTAISIYDSSIESVGSYDPGLVVQGITVEYNPATATVPTYSITINSPKENENIYWSAEGYPVKGTISGINSNLNTYVLVHPTTTDKWWIQHAPTVGNGNWETMVYLGTKDVGANENYEIYAIVTDKTLNEGTELGALPDYSAMARVTVFRPVQGVPPVTPAPTTEQKDSKLAPVPTPHEESSNSYLYAGIGGIVLLLVAITALKRRSSSQVKEPLKPVTAVRYESQKSAPEHKEAAPELRQTAVSKTEAPGVESAQHMAPVYRASGVGVKTAFGYKGATIIYKLKIENNISDPISDIKVYPYVPDVFLLKEKEKSIALIEPKSSQTVTFEIRPTGECGDCNVSGRVNYYDMVSRKRQDIELEPKSLSIVCPMLHGKEISEMDWHDTVSNLVKTEESTKEIDMPAESLFTMVSRIIKDMHMYMQKPETTQNHQLFNGVARFYGEGVKGLKYAAQVEVVGRAKKSKLILKAWAEKEDALTGFYHGILDEIEKRVNVKGYIDDSIVQYNVTHIDIKDSVIQRSNIGARMRKCPNCGREVESNEKFCPECGAKL